MHISLTSEFISVSCKFWDFSCGVALQYLPVICSFQWKDPPSQCSAGVCVYRVLFACKDKAILCVWGSKPGVQAEHLKIYLEIYLGRRTLAIGNTVAILICSFVMTGRRLVNFNFWFQKLSNSAQMRNQFSQLLRLCGKKASCHWRTDYHMTQPGISSVGPCCSHLNYSLPLVIYLYNI